jgi:hypothetical protein
MMMLAWADENITEIDSFIFAKTNGGYFGAPEGAFLKCKKSISAVKLPETPTEWKACAKARTDINNCLTKFGNKISSIEYGCKKDGVTTWKLGA